MSCHISAYSGTSWKNESLAITICHHSASLLMPKSDPLDGLFYPTLTLMMDAYILSQHIWIYENLSWYRNSYLTMDVTCCLYIGCIGSHMHSYQMTLLTHCNVKVASCKVTSQSIQELLEAYLKCKHSIEW